jgi:hypothetical protein
MKAKRSWVAVAVGLVGLAIPGTVQAATTLGQTAPDSASVAVLNGPTLIVQDQVAGPPAYTVPDAGGVITSWSVQGGTTPSYPVKLKLVTRDADPTSFTFVGEDTSRPIAQGALNTFETRIPVSGGELLGLWVGTAMETSAAFFDAAPGDNARYGIGPHQEPTIGQSFQTDTPIAEARLNVSAILEPDCDGDGFGDETQDPDVPLGGPCPKGTRTIILDANKNKVKKGKKVRLSGQLAEVVRQACRSDQAVELQRKKPKKANFKTVETLQTDAAGAFSTKEKVKKTFEYRAQVAETGTCGAAASNTEKVKVKKPQ